MGFIDSEDSGRNLVDLKPGIADRLARKTLVFGARERATPLRNAGLREHRRDGEQQSDGQSVRESAHHQGNSTATNFAACFPVLVRVCV
jgi:hypothetical protein